MAAFTLPPSVRLPVLQLHIERTTPPADPASTADHLAGLTIPCGYALEKELELVAFATTILSRQRRTADYLVETKASFTSDRNRTYDIVRRFDGRISVSPRSPDSGADSNLIGTGAPVGELREACIDLLSATQNFGTRVGLLDDLRTITKTLLGSTYARKAFLVDGNHVELGIALDEKKYHLALDVAKTVNVSEKSMIYSYSVDFLNGTLFSEVRITRERPARVDGHIVAGDRVLLNTRGTEKNPDEALRHCYEIYELVQHLKDAKLAAKTAEPEGGAMS